MYCFATQSIGLGSIDNARELGGYVLPDGRAIKRGLLLRGGSLADANNDDLCALTDKYRIKLNFDFRTEDEVIKKPDPELDGVERIWLPAIDQVTEKKASSEFPQGVFKDFGRWVLAHASEPRVLRFAQNMYVDFVVNEYTQLQYAAFLQNIVNNAGCAVYWHCTQGKDRTGLASTFLLAALGADRKLILEDYLISNEVFKPLVDRMMAAFSDENAQEVIQTFVGVNVNSFLRALNIIDIQFGSMDNYLRGPLCMTDNDITLLKDNYTYYE